jgi:hypothetical protein
LDSKDPNVLADEFLRSELKYVDQALRILHDTFLVPLQKALTLEEPILPDHDIREIFLNLGSVYTFNRNLFSELLNTRLQNQLLENLGSIMLQYIPFFKQYAVYTQGYRDAQSRLKELRQTNSSFAKFLRLYEACCGYRLDDLLEAPVYRLPQYLQYLLIVGASCDEAGAAQSSITEAVEAIQSVMDQVSVTIRDQNSRALVSQAQTEWFGGTCILIDPSRLVIKHGELKVVNEKSLLGQKQIKLKNVMAILCNDCFAYGVTASKSALGLTHKGKILGAWRLDAVLLEAVDEFDGEPAHGLRIRGSPGEALFLCQDEEQRLKWKKAIQSAVSKYVQLKPDGDPIEFHRHVMKDERRSVLGRARSSSKPPASNGSSNGPTNISSPIISSPIISSPMGTPPPPAPALESKESKESPPSKESKGSGSVIERHPSGGGPESAPSSTGDSGHPHHIEGGKRVLPPLPLGLGGLRRSPRGPVPTPPDDAVPAPPPLDIPAPAPAASPAAPAPPPLSPPPMEDSSVPPSHQPTPQSRGIPRPPPKRATSVPRRPLPPLPKDVQTSTSSPEDAQASLVPSKDAQTSAPPKKEAQTSTSTSTLSGSSLPEKPAQKSTQAVAGPPEGRLTLLDQIKRGKSLKKVDRSAPKPDAHPAPAEEGDGIGKLAYALQSSLQRYRKFVQNEEESDDEDDGDWAV